MKYVINAAAVVCYVILVACVVCHYSRRRSMLLMQLLLYVIIVACVVCYNSSGEVCY